MISRKKNNLFHEDKICSLRKHPVLVALRRWGGFARRNVVPSRETSPAAKSEEKRMFSQAIKFADDH